MRIPSPLVCGLIAFPLFLQAQQPVYLDISQSSGCIRRMEYQHMPAGQVSAVYTLADPSGYFQALTTGIPDTVPFRLSAPLLSL
ncbi:MAG: hypothetical protein IPH12_09385 [Saprospirales bacterium]|nr:hypothetical protein [Saprospirales bacterium]